MYRTHRIHHPAEAARTTSVIATTSAPHLRTPHARATGEIAHARERIGPVLGRAGASRRPQAAPTPTPPPTTHPRSTP